jgi:3-dehydroquinate synthase
VLVDEHTKQYCLPQLAAVLPELITIEISSGEEHKNISTCELIWKQLIDHQADRQAALINLGGGVIGDMGGFAAATYKRGIAFIQVPTTVLSQVDSSIGGKLGVDFKYGKNLIGLFKDPELVFIYPPFLQSLPKRQFLNGFAEIFKHALVNDKEQWGRLKNLDIQKCDIAQVVHDSLLVKKNIVEQDPFESGLRKILNFGHTIGHALEAYSLEHDQEPLLHGEAIALGMIAEAWLSVQLCGLEINTFDEIRSVLALVFPKRDISVYDTGLLLEYMKMDKKNAGSKIRFALLKSIGQSVWDINVNEKQILDDIEAV